MKLTTALLGVALTASTNAAVLAKNAPTAKIKNGTVAGRFLPEYGQDLFLGVPYAQPPVNDLRFRVAQSLNTTFSGTWDASQYSSECIGYGSDQVGYKISEDCLYLNIVRPTGTKPNAKLPVGFWIHGGVTLRVAESTNATMYDQVHTAIRTCTNCQKLSFIVQNSVKIGTPMIGVSINYRLSAWGQIAGTAVAGSGNSNIALRDQRLAMHWVQENIDSFGGDPKKVTIWGESAGGSSVGFHLTAYGGRDDGLFRGAIIESGCMIQYRGLYGPSYYDRQYNALVTTVGCQNSSDTLECMRQLPFATLNAAINGTNPSTFSWPVLDGDFNQRFGSIQLAEGAFVHVPIILGANGDEGVSFGPRGINTEAQFLPGLIAGNLSYPGVGLAPNLAQTILDAYPDDPCVGIPETLGCTRPTLPLGAEYRRTSAYAGDSTFIACRRKSCETWAEAGVNAYCYRFEGWVNGLTYMSGVPHFQEVSLVFDNTLGVGYDFAPNPFANRPQALKDLATLMSNSWASFIATGNPNMWRQTDTTIPLWPAYNAQNPENIVFTSNVTSFLEADTYRAAGINAINALNIDQFR